MNTQDRISAAYEIGTLAAAAGVDPVDAALGLATVRDGIAGPAVDIGNPLRSGAANTSNDTVDNPHAPRVDEV